MSLNKSHAEAVAEAIMQPNLDAQAALTRRREGKARRSAMQARIAALALVGTAIGAAVGLLGFDRMAPGVLVGGVLGALVGRLLASAGGAASDGAAG
ncbi:hypothetical protein [Coralloluteibacterium stylophorae]|uniref:Uncharacterized protein n=2 Tax=Coralloluteibacterium stylophorae TaxID=1776034 RepID=A0AAP2CBT8_9GAMM|nr:hypothetical protein [Coralloluteibacterium stylophorae]MBS7457359.1 hypothetical protein [Coralloluteibacterium stylophorae]